MDELRRNFGKFNFSEQGSSGKTAARERDFVSSFEGIFVHYSRVH